MLSWKFKRSITVAIPLFTGFLFLGILKGIFGVDAATNIADTGITVGFVFGLLNLWLWWMVYKHRVP